MGLFFLFSRLKKKTVKAIALLLIVLFFPKLVSTNYTLTSRRYSFAAYDYGENILFSLRPDSILIVYGDSPQFILWYLHLAERMREDITLISANNIAWTVPAKHIRWPKIGEFKRKTPFFKSLFQMNPDASVYLINIPVSYTHLTLPTN
mgnify:CR=1 FL=1